MIVEHQDSVRGSEPPTGDLLDRFVNEAKAGVFERIEPKKSKRVTLGIAGVITSALVMLAVGTAAGAAVAGGVLNSNLPISGRATVALPIPDFEATELVVTLTCVSKGQYTVSVPGLGKSYMTIDCDGNARPSSGTAEFKVSDPSVARSLSIETTSVGGTYTVDAEYIATKPQDFPTNDHGQSYGRPVAKATNIPDLIFAVGEDDDGLPVQGYVLHSDTQIPEGVAAHGWIPWLNEFHRKYPDGQPLPLYSNNGTSVIGIFRFHR